MLMAHPKNQIALIQGKQTLHYDELQLLIDKYCKQIESYGLDEGTRVAIYLPKTIDNVVLMLTCLKLGLVFVPINPALKPDQVWHIIEDAGASLLITDASRTTRLNDDTRTFEVTDLDVLSPLAALHIANKSNHPAPTQLAALLYTSGSTGRPKGVMISHENLQAGSSSVIEYLGLSDQDTLLCALPFSFDYGLNQLFTMLQVGGTAVLIDYLLPSQLLDAIESNLVTGLGAVPTLWRQLLSSNNCHHLSRLRFITNSGGALTEDILVKLSQVAPNTDIYSMYGLTEAFRATYLPPDKLADKPRSVGQAIPQAQVEIVDDNEQICPAYKHGEIIQRGAHVSLGYWNNPAATTAKFRTTNIASIDDTWVFSGDIGYKDEVGDLYIVGRRDEQIKVSGYRVSPDEIAAAALAAGASQAKAIGIEDPHTGQAIILFVTLTLKHIKGFETRLKANLPNFMHPAQIIKVESMPLSANGKIDTNNLKQQYLHG